MTNITLTRFHRKPATYGYADSYKGCLDPNAGINCPGIHSHMAGLIRNINQFQDEPTAWSFSEWSPVKGGKNTKDNWLRATAVVLEYRIKGAAAEAAVELSDKAEDLGYAHIMMDSLSRNGAKTITIVFPLTETVNEDQYARLAKVLMSELGRFRAADGNCAMTHLIHVDKTCTQVVVPGGVISPRHKIKETANLYQNMDPNYFCYEGPADAAQLEKPVVTSNDGMFEWPETDAETIMRRMEQVIPRHVGRSIGCNAGMADLTQFGKRLDD